MEVLWVGMSIILTSIVIFRKKMVLGVFTLGIRLLTKTLMENQMKPMTETLGEKLIRCGWVTNFNVKTLVKLIEEHFSSRIPSAPTPISVNDRLPGPEDCDNEGRCWSTHTLAPFASPSD